MSPALLSPRQATFLFLRRPEQLTPEEQADLLTLRQTHPEVDQTYDLVQQFAQMLRTRSGEQLDTWLAKVAESQIPELQSFLFGIERDKSAVVAGLTLPHSNGIGDRKGQQIKASETHGIWEGRLPTATSAGVACTLESEDKHDSFIRGTVYHPHEMMPALFSTIVS